MPASNTHDDESVVVVFNEDNATTPLLATAATEEYTIDDALSHIGYGRMQRLLLTVLGSCYASCAATVFLMLFLDPNVKCEWGLDEAQENMISLVAFVGMLMGANVFGTLADRFGRKVSTSLGLGVMGFGGLMMSLAPNYWALLAFRWIAALGAGSATMYTMYSEFLPTKSRGVCLGWYQFTWPAGSILQTACAWFIVPTHGWRALSCATALFTFALIPALGFLPESPRYLLVAGYPDHATHVLKRIAAMNGTSVPDGTLKLPPINDSSHEPASRAGVLSQFVGLFKSPLDRVTSVMWTLAFSLGLSYFGMIILSASVEAVDGTSACIGKSANVTNHDYLSILINTTAEIPSFILLILTVGRLGRVRSLVTGASGSLTGLLLLMMFPAQAHVLLFATRLLSSYAFGILFVLTPEIYPSSCRCLATGITVSITKMGAMASPFVARALFDSYGLTCVCLVFVTLFCLTDIASIFLLPFETSGKALKDDIDELREEFTSGSTNDTDSVNPTAEVLI